MSGAVGVTYRPDGVGLPSTIGVAVLIESAALSGSAPTRADAPMQRIDSAKVAAHIMAFAHCFPLSIAVHTFLPRLSE